MGGVPAVSKARRRIERLRGVQFCRRALEIRSEDSAPALIRPHGFGGNLELFVPDGFWFGRAGGTGEAFCCVGGVGLRRALPAPAKEP